MNGRISSKFKSKLLKLDSACAFARHINEPFADHFLNEFKAMLQGGQEEMHMAEKHGPKEEHEAKDGKVHPGFFLEPPPACSSASGDFKEDIVEVIPGNQVSVKENIVEIIPVMPEPAPTSPCGTDGAAMEPGEPLCKDEVIKAFLDAFEAEAVAKKDWLTRLSARVEEMKEKAANLPKVEAQKLRNVVMTFDGQLSLMEAEVLTMVANGRDELQRRIEESTAPSTVAEESRARFVSITKRIGMHQRTSEPRPTTKKRRKGAKTRIGG